MHVRVVANADYMLSDPARRAEYDRMRTQQGYASDADDASTQDESARFFRMFGGADAQEQPHAQDLFANVLEEMLRPEVERHSMSIVLTQLLSGVLQARYLVLCWAILWPTGRAVRTRH